MMQNTKTNTSKPTQEETQHAIKKTTSSKTIQGEAIQTQEASTCKKKQTEAAQTISNRHNQGEAEQCKTHKTSQHKHQEET